MEQFLEQVASVIDAHLSSLGVPVPVGGTSAAALEGLNADGALVLALEATWPGGTAPDAATAILEGARSRYYGSKKVGNSSVSTGSPNLDSVIDLIEVSTPGVGGAGDLWSDEGIVDNESLPGETLTIGRSMRL